jgi:peptidoglycan pentaglycine glycine transferase (the first glycine)
MEKNEKNSEFLQSAQWRKFQESVGRKTFLLESEDFLASVIEHSLPIVGKYWYAPRGPIFNENIKKGMQQLIELGRKEEAGWIRIEPKSTEMLEIIRNTMEISVNKLQIVKAPHDMQPREIFAIDISKSEEELLAQMKPKTRYNIRLAQKHKISVQAISNFQFPISNEYVEAFLKLTKEMAARHGITAHPEEYYRKMVENLPAEMLRIYVAEYEGKIIAANLVLFFEKTVTYLHGASGNENRNVMAPFLLQWQAILDAKKLGFERYDFGGVRTISNIQNSTDNKNTWEGITTFKLGFSPSTKPVEFPGSYDIIINPAKYAMYRGLQRAKELMVRFRK